MQHITSKVRGRNDLCWCDSGKKYKKCHMKQDQLVNNNLLNPQNNFKQRPIIPREKEFIEGMVKACRFARKNLEMIEEYIRPGITTNQLNQIVHEYTLDHNAIPAPLNYKGFPKSICTSINEVVCHGIPDNTELKEGDIINIDVTPIVNGYHGDTNKTFFVGECSEVAKKLVRVTKECLEKALATIKPYHRIGDIGAIIQEHAHFHKYSVVENFVGHSIGKEFHEEPSIPHFGIRGTGQLIVPGMFFTIEPMINEGRKETNILSDGWTAVTQDGTLSAQFEHTVFITDTELRVLTAEKDDMPIF